MTVDTETSFKTYCNAVYFCSVNYTIKVINRIYKVLLLHVGDQYWFNS